MPRTPSKGPGWGGPAKGAAEHRGPKTDVTKAGPGRGHMGTKGMARAERIQRWRDILDEIATDEAMHPGARVSAAINLLDRDEGKPATVIQGDTTKPITVVQRIVIDPRNPDGAGVSPASDAE